MFQNAVMRSDMILQAVLQFLFLRNIADKTDRSVFGIQLGGQRNFRSFNPAAFTFHDDEFAGFFFFSRSACSRRQYFCFARRFFINQLAAQQYCLFGRIRMHGFGIRRIARGDLQFFVAQPDRKRQAVKCLFK